MRAVTNLRPRLVLAALALASLAAAAPARTPKHPKDTVSTHARSTATLAPGVYVIRHEDAPDTFPQGNTTVIVGARDVLVVDSCYLPSSAVKDIAQIRQWTAKPVRYLVNTHWHYDHTMGNGAYRDAFPGITIVAHVETRKQIASYNPQWFANFPRRADKFRQAIDARKDENGKALSDGELAEYKTALAGLEPVSKEFQPLAARRDLAPDAAFDRELDLDLGGREVRLLHLGRGNTAGDAVVFLPKEKILVAGDLVDHPVPYLGGGYPLELVGTLEALARLDFDALVPGHGAILHGKAYVTQVTEFVRAVVAAVDAEVTRAGAGAHKLDVVKAAVLAKLPVAEWRKRFAGDDAEAKDFFDGFALDGVITAAYAATWGR
jgi:glyoxylase-like metal-dependent hydrolase (beta-lactamase superfamily II)